MTLLDTEVGLNLTGRQCAMTSYRASFTSTKTPEDAFEYLATFSNAVEWDPSVISGTPRTPGEVTVASVFDLVVGFSGRTIPLAYSVLELDRPRKVVLEAKGPQFTSHDEISVAPAERGCVVTYDATITMAGAWKLADPLVARTFRKTADAAIEGLKRALG
jgi:hypothetical protein